uniref:EF-hand domain-containing protein n=1 Tax=Quercus lobata TaxID=97700 RepID=A0A7N2MJ93_QUELO
MSASNSNHSQPQSLLAWTAKSLGPIDEIDQGPLNQFLRSQGFVSSYDDAHKYTESDADAHKWVSHRNHRVCNPNKSRKPLRTSWAEAVFSIKKYLLRKASLAEDDAFAFLKGDNHGDFITISALREALRQVNLIGHPYGLSFQDMKNLWVQADINGDGVIDCEEFKVSSSPKSLNMT